MNFYLKAIGKNIFMLHSINIHWFHEQGTIVANNTYYVTMHTLKKEDKAYVHKEKFFHQTSLSYRAKKS